MKGFMIFSVMLIAGTTAHAAMITVTSLTDAGGAGICVLRDAITAANTMAAANGCGAGDGNDTIEFSLRGQINLAATLPAIANQLVIDGPAGLPRITIDGGGRVQVLTVLPGAVVSLNNLVIAHGLADATQNGGGIYNQGQLTISKGAFANNVALIPCPLHCFGFDVGGGAIYNQGGRVIVAGTKFANNRAVYGGAVLNRFGTLTIRNSGFANNNNGAVHMRGGTVTIAHSTFTGNTGHAVADEQGTLIITASTFSGNSDNGEGAALFNNGKTSIINSTFFNNQVTGSPSFGGAISNDGTLTILASTIAGNGAQYGGGINNIGAFLTIKSTILAGNAGDNCDLEVGSYIDAGYNIADDSSCDFGAVGSSNNTDLMLDPNGLRNNGGPTQTIALLAGSPAIDAIPVADCTDVTGKPITVDQRGLPRPGNGDTGCSGGAYEFQNH